MPTAPRVQTPWRGLAAACALGLVVLLAPAPPGMPPLAQRTAAIFAFALVLWATEAAPTAITALLAVVLQPMLAIRPPGPAFASFMSPVFFFVLAAFFLTSALVTTGLQRRFAAWLVARAGTDPRRLLFALMAGTGALSCVLSDVPTCAVFMSAALGVFARSNIQPGSTFGKAVMVGVPMAALIGGVGTPAGSSINVLGIHFIEQFGKVRVSFLAWTAIGLPMVLVLVPFAWFVLVRWFPPEMVAVGDAREADEELRSLGPLSRDERKFLVLAAGMMTAWIVSTWVPAIDLVVVAVIGAVIVFLPGMRLLSWDVAQRGVGWDALLMIGGVTSLGAATVETGLARWIVDALLGGAREWPVPLAIAAISAFAVLAHLPIPIAPVINSVLIPPVVLLALAAGVNPALYALPVAFTASCAFLLPLDAVSLLTYAKGYYRMLDMLIPGLIVSAAWVVWMTVLLVVLGPALGLY